MTSVSASPKNRPKHRDRRRPARSPRPAPLEPPSPRHDWLIGVLVVVGIIAYANSFSGVFLLDDLPSIVDNPYIRTLAVRWGGRWLVEFSLAVNRLLGGFDPSGYHLVNLVVHLLAGLTLFLIVRGVLRRDSEPVRRRAAAPWIALAAALVWMVHPLQTQAVTYVIQRAESMAGLLYLLTLYCVLRGADAERPRRWNVAAVIACAAGMVTKPVAATIPVTALLFDRAFITPSFREIVRRRWRVHAALFATWLLLLSTGIVGRVTGTNASAATSLGFGYEGVSWIEYARTQPGVILHYLRLSLWPHPLCLDYWWPVATSAAAIAVPLAVLVVLALLTLWALRARPRLGFLGAAFFLVLAPTSSIMPIKDLAVEHRMYLPLAPVVILLVLAAERAIAFARARWALTAETTGKIAAAGVIAVTVACTVATIRRNHQYRSSLVMWRDVLDQRPDNPRAHANFGMALARYGRPEEAIEHYERAIAIDPDTLPAHANLGLLLVDRNRLDEGIAHLREAARLAPDDAVAFANLGQALSRKEAYEEAEQKLREAIRLDPDLAGAYNNLAGVLMAQGRVDEAIACVVEAIRLEPANSSAIGNLAAVLSRRDDIDEVIARYGDRAPLAPVHAQAQALRGDRLLAEGRRDEALEAYRRALVIDPTNALARSRLLARNPRRRKKATRAPRP